MSPSAPSTSSTSTRWRWSSRSAPPPSSRVSRSSSRPSSPGTRGAEELDAAGRVGSLLAAFEAGLRKTLARMGISAVASYIGGALVDVVDLDAVGRRALLPDRRRLARPDDPRRPCRPPAPPPRGRARHPRPPPVASRACPDPGFARFRADGEAHLFSPRIAGEIQVASRPRRAASTRRRPRCGPGALSDALAPVAGDALGAARRAPGPPADARRRSTRSSPPGRSSGGSSSRR